MHAFLLSELNGMAWGVVYVLEDCGTRFVCGDLSASGTLALLDLGWGGAPRHSADFTACVAKSSFLSNGHF